MIRKHLLLAGLSITAMSTSFATGHTDTLDGGGRRTASENYAMDGSLGGFGVIGEGGGVTLKPGYIGQLTEVTDLIVSTTPDAVNEGETSQLSGIAELDDATVTAIEGRDIVWSAPLYPIDMISSGGLATAMTVYSDTVGSVTGHLLGTAGTGVLTVWDSDLDNFGLYGGDQIPDSWQVMHFGLENPSGLASATNATGRSNWYAYTADLDPTDPESSFEIMEISSLPASKTVSFLSSSNRLYRLEWTTDLVSGPWTNVSGAIPTLGNGDIFWLADTNTVSRRFYRVGVRTP